MSKKNKIPFTRLSSNFEVIFGEDLNALKGGGDSDTWEGSPGSPEDPKELDPVVVTPDPEPEEPDPLPEPDPIETNPDPTDPDWEAPPEDDGGYGDDDPVDDDNDPSDCNLVYANMPVGNGSDTQMMNTCATTVFKILNSMNTGTVQTIDSVITEIATIESEKNGTPLWQEKLKLLNDGVSPQQADSYIDSHYTNSDMAVNYNNVQSSIQGGKAVFAYFDTGEVDNGVAVAHAVMITGVTSDSKITYYDPQTDTYTSTNDFGKFLSASQITIDREPAVQCN